MPSLSLIRRPWMNVLIATAQIVAAVGTAVLSAPQPVAASTALAPAAQSAATITGTVFQDYNSNGVMNTTGLAPNLAIDAGVSGVTASAYVSGSLSAATTTTTDASGAYTLTGLTSGTPYRVEFTGLPSSYYPSYHGTNSGTSVQFVNGGAGNVDFGINEPCDYCQNDPMLVTTRMELEPELATQMPVSSLWITPQVALRSNIPMTRPLPKSVRFGVSRTSAAPSGCSPVLF